MKSKNNIYLNTAEQFPSDLIYELSTWVNGLMYNNIDKINFYNMFNQ